VDPIGVKDHSAIAWDYCGTDNQVFSSLSHLNLRSAIDGRYRFMLVFLHQLQFAMVLMNCDINVQVLSITYIWFTCASNGIFGEFLAGEVGFQICLVCVYMLSLQQVAGVSQ
jgi:hypothetical protein